MKLLQVKDDIIWKLLTDKKERYEEDVVIMKEKHENEIVEFHK
jgi:hypothetical protein